MDEVEPQSDPESEPQSEDDLRTPTGFRIARSLMLLAAATVLLFGIPYLGWQLATTLAREQFDVDGRTFLVSITRRGEVVVWVQRDGETERHVVEPPEGAAPDGPGRIEIADDHRSFVAHIGATVVTFEYADGTFVRR